MYRSKFLLNRQKLVTPEEICRALDSYFADYPVKQQKYIYRIEWYHIGISVPVVVYSESSPKMQVFKECQLYESKFLDDIPEDNQVISFKLFAVPSKSKTSFSNNELGVWFKDILADCAEIKSIEFGPHNCVYTINKDESHTRHQTYSLSGKILILNRKKLQQLRDKGIGFGFELGCGLLELA